MQDSIGLIVKVFGLSLVLSLILKYVGPFLALQPTTINALIGISLPPVAIALLLWRASLKSSGG